MKRVKITGGPAPADVKITLEPDGIDITHQVLAIEVLPGHNQLLKAKLTVFAECDLVANLEVNPVWPTPGADRT